MNKVSTVWRKLFGWQVGDYLKYYFLPSGNEEGKWLTLRIIRISSSDFVEVKVLSKNFGIDKFNLRIAYVEEKVPWHLKDYAPRDRTKRRLNWRNRVALHL